MSGLIAMTLSMSAVVLTAPAASAATVQNCFNHTGPTYAAWSNAHGFTYSPGGWCMRQPGNGRGRLVFQTDGNFVIYNSPTTNTPPNPAYNVVWASGTNGKGATRLVFQTDGNIVIYKGASKLWVSGTNQLRGSYTGSFYALPAMSMEISVTGARRLACTYAGSRNGGMIRAVAMNPQYTAQNCLT